MKKLILFIILILSLFCAQAQETLYGIEQVKGTETIVKDRLAEIGASGDYTFLVLLPVGGCPRCEGSIPLFFNDTQKYFPEVYTLLFAISDTPISTAEELSTKNYGTNNLVCTNDDDPLMQSFHFKTGVIGVPYIVIINNNTGDFISASSLLGITYDLNFFKSLTDDLNVVKVEKISLTTSNNISDKISPSKVKLNILDNKNYNINCSELSKISNISFSKDLSKLALLEYETSSILLAEKKADQYVFTDTIRPDDLEYYIFKAKNVPDTLALALRFMNVLQIIYLDIYFTNNAEDLMISASLPNLYWEDSIAEQLVYSNQACLIKYNLKEESKTITPMQLDSEYITSHSHFFVDEEKQRIFMGVLKGWPTQGTTAEPNSADNDPFLDSFYDFSPMMSILSTPECAFTQFLGNLPNWHKKEHTGYFYFSPKVCFDKKNVVVADTYAGEITTFDRNTLKQLSSFNITDVLLQKGLLVTDANAGNNTPSKSKLQSILDKKNLLPCRILDIAYNKDTYYILLTDEKNVILYIYLPKTNMLFSSESIESYLSNTDNIKIFYDKGEIKVISLDDRKASLNIMTFTH